MYDMDNLKRQLCAVLLPRCYTRTAKALLWKTKSEVLREQNDANYATVEVIIVLFRRNKRLGQDLISS
jgi:DNA recombination-dependent growth factor C